LASARWRRYLWEYGKYELAAFGRNITDEEVIVGGIDFNNLTGFLNEPRIWGVEFKATFEPLDRRRWGCCTSRS
jgi:hypothetical protein